MEGVARPGVVTAVAVICFVEAAFCGVGALAGVVILVLGVKAGGAGTASGLLIAAGVVVLVACLVLGVLYLLCGRGLLRRRRGWYLAVLALLALSVVIGGAGFAAEQNLWDLLWPAIDLIALGLLVAIPQSRAYFAEQRGSQAAGAGSSSS